MDSTSSVNSESSAENVRWAYEQLTKLISLPPLSELALADVVRWSIEALDDRGPLVGAAVGSIMAQLDRREVLLALEEAFNDPRPMVRS